MFSSIQFKVFNSFSIGLILYGLLLWLLFVIGIVRVYFAFLAFPFLKQTTKHDIELKKKKKKNKKTKNITYIISCLKIELQLREMVPLRPLYLKQKTFNISFVCFCEMKSFVSTHTYTQKSKHHSWFQITVFYLMQFTYKSNCTDAAHVYCIYFCLINLIVTTSLKNNLNLNKIPKIII